MSGPARSLISQHNTTIVNKYHKHSASLSISHISRDLAICLLLSSIGWSVVSDVDTVPGSRLSISTYLYLSIVHLLVCRYASIVSKWTLSLSFSFSRSLSLGNDGGTTLRFAVSNTTLTKPIQHPPRRHPFIKRGAHLHQARHQPTSGPVPSPSLCRAAVHVMREHHQHHRHCIVVLLPPHHPSHPHIHTSSHPYIILNRVRVEP